MAIFEKLAADNSPVGGFLAVLWVLNRGFWTKIAIFQVFNRHTSSSAMRDPRPVDKG